MQAALHCRCIVIVSTTLRCHCVVLTGVVPATEAVSCCRSVAVVVAALAT
jgi:hypothetical protein